MIPSYGGHILKVNLTSGEVKVEETPDSLIREFIGGKGFGAKFLYDLVGGEVDPLSPENLLIIAGGPAAGTRIPLTSRVVFSFRSPLTNGYAESTMGGYFAPWLKWAGYDAILVWGRSEKPVYLYVDENGGEIRDAGYLWGKYTREVEETLRKELGGKSAVLEIGPAGENLVRFASVCHSEAGRQAGRCGAGAVMGSKRLKAIAVIADRREVDVADEKAVTEFANSILNRIKNNPIETGAENYRKYGTPAMVEIANRLRFFPTRYWSDVYFEKHENIEPQAISKYIVRNAACWNCPFACGKIVEIKEGPYAGTRVEGPEYETIFALGGLCLIDSIPAIAKLNLLCDLLGLDTITMGNVAGFAIEAYGRGVLKTDGRELRYGDPECVAWLIEEVAYRRGVGELLSMGVRRSAESLGLREIAIESRGLEPPAYDPRSLTGMALSYALGDRGACHLRANMYAPDIAGQVDRFKIDRRKVEVYIDNENRYNLFDSMVLCRFARNVYFWKEIEAMWKALTGIDYSVEELRMVAERIQALTRRLNIRFGLGPEEDKISPRFYKEPVKVDDRVVAVDEAELKAAVKEYYRLRGWGEDGKPSKETLTRLGIPEK